MFAAQPPDPAHWEGRARWLHNVLADARDRREDDAEMADHTAALLAELETVFAAGAWVATVILAASIVEAHLRASMPEIRPYGNAVSLFEEAGLTEEHDWLRRRRNRLLHVSDPPALTPDMHWFQADELEADARRAVTLMADALFRPLYRPL